MIESGIKEKQIEASGHGADYAAMAGTSRYWYMFVPLLDQTPMQERTEYTDGEFCTALESYRNQGISVSIHAADPLVRMFALFDRRVGRRTLANMQEEMATQPEWLQRLYAWRCAAENIS